MLSIRTIKRYEAIRRGLAFIYRTACDPDNFELYGYDYLCCFHCIASTSKNVSLRSAARDMGRERALEWRRDHSELPPDTDADAIAYLVFGSDAADRLGLRDSRLKEQIRGAAECFNERDYFGFDPATEPPPEDVPEECECGAANPRGHKTCGRCKKRLTSFFHLGHARTISIR